MRVRLQSQPPLSPLKAWFEIPLALVNPQETIEDLKVELCRKVLTPPWTGNHGPSDTLKGNEKLRADQIILEIDGFELLDGSAVNVIRENDLILYALILILLMLVSNSSYRIKYKSLSMLGQKRKRRSSLGWFLSAS
jgi:hypothetical protein